MNQLFVILMAVVAHAIYPSQSSQGCKTTEKGSEYRGAVSKTRSGITCQAWASQTPHGHVNTPSKWPRSGLLENYCRNPDNTSGGPWCYTMDSKKRWEFCPVPFCAECKTTEKGSEYRGAVSKTKSGITCQAWASQTPHGHVNTPSKWPRSGLLENYCRNPDNTSGSPWCYTMDSKKRWEFCPVPFCAASCGISGKVTRSASRVVGGTVAVEGDFPWMVAIVRSGNLNSIHCGGTLLNHRWILTAAHCFVDQRPQIYRIRLGEHDFTKKEGHQKVVEIDYIKVHDKYDDPILYNNDIALLRLKKSVEFNKYIKPICLPKQGETFRDGVKCLVAGWGRLRSGGAKPTKLQKVEVPIVSQKLCKKSYRSEISDVMFCSGFKRGGKDSCQGDSGGPLFCQRDDGAPNYVQVGIVSWGKGCALANYYGVYTKVSSFTKWIEDHIKKNQ